MRSRFSLLVLACLASACADAPVTNPALRVDPRPDLESVTLTPVALHNCYRTPVWAAYRNNGGAWTRVLPQGNSVKFSATQRFAFAYVTVLNDGTAELFVHYMTVGDSLWFPGSCPIRDRNFTGTFAGVNWGPQEATVDAGTRTATRGTDSPWLLESVERGYLDFLAGRKVLDGNSYVMNKFIFRRHRLYANGATVPVFDFASDKAVTPVMKNVSITGMDAGESPFVVTRFSTPTSELLTSTRFTNLPTTIPFVRQTQLQPGDLQAVFAKVYSSSANREVRKYFYQPSDVVIELPPQVAAPEFTVLTESPYLRLRVKVARQPEYDALHEVDIYQGQRELYFIWTAGYFSSIPDVWRIDEPDFSGVDGFDPAWVPVSGEAADWFILGQGLIDDRAATAGTSYPVSSLSSTAPFTP